MNVARIFLDEPPPLERGWCWRDDWVHGFDSAYALLSKFAMLNALNAAELAQLFIRRDCGKKTAIVRSPTVDLRHSALFDLAQMARLLRLETQQIQQAFLPEHLENGRRRFRDVLCWCPQCARTGFHSSAFQLEVVRSCPVHGDPIRTCCKTCGAVIPYQLQMAVFTQPFCCPACHADLAPAFRDPKERLLAAIPPRTNWISDLATLCAFDDRTMPTQQEIIRRRTRDGLAPVVFASSNWQRPASDYSVFIDSVWQVVETKQGSAHLSGTHATLVVASKGPSELPIRCKSRRAARRLPGIRRTKVSKSGTKNAWDEQLRLSYLVYGAVRRHLWRHLLKAHQYCITSAAKHLDWRLEGFSTATICPVAEAFLRWRMHWEGIGTPTNLLTPQVTMPSGLAGWLGTHAPICPLCWTRTAEQWVSDHVLGQHAIATFRTFLESALAEQRAGRIAWHSVIVSAHHLPYWAIVGRDTVADPVTLFSENGDTSTLHALIRQTPSTVQHQQWHRDSLHAIQCGATAGA